MIPKELRGRYNELVREISQIPFMKFYRYGTSIATNAMLSGAGYCFNRDIDVIGTSLMISSGMTLLVKLAIHSSIRDMAENQLRLEEKF